MNFFRKLIQKIRYLFESKKPNHGLPTLEVAAIAEQFNLRGEAEKLALLGLPAFHSKTLTNTELEVVRYIERAREQIQRQTQVDLDKMDDLIHQAQASQFDIKVSQLTADFERKALIVFNEQNAWLEKLGNQAKRKTAELERFRLQNKLERDAIYPDGTGLFLRYAFLMLLIVFEGIFNASFFAEGLSSGLLGGFVYSATLAAINVVVMFLLGKTVVRWLFHVATPMKVLGLLGACFAAAYTLSVALSVAHLRAAILLESANPTQSAWNSLVQAPWALNDLMSWALFLITLGFGLASLIDGLFIDDLYPGYGAITRREKAAVEEFEEEFEEVRENLEDIKEQNMRALEDEIIKAHQIAARLRQAIDDKKTIYKSWQQTLDDAEVTLYAALRIFRAENEKHRHDAMRPAYFDTLPRLAPAAITQSNLQQHENDYLEMLQTIKALDDNLQARKEKIHATFDQHVDQLNFIKSRQPTGAA